MQGGQRLCKHLRREQKEAVLESKIQHIEQFSPILVEGLIRITNSDDKRREKGTKRSFKNPWARNLKLKKN